MCPRIVVDYADTMSAKKAYIPEQKTMGYLPLKFRFCEIIDNTETRILIFAETKTVIACLKVAQVESFEQHKYMVQKSRDIVYFILFITLKVFSRKVSVYPVVKNFLISYDTVSTGHAVGSKPRTIVGQAHSFCKLVTLVTLQMKYPDLFSQ